MKNVSVICPVCNEKDNLEELVKRIFSSLHFYSESGKMELILVDDGSKDGSSDIIISLQKNFRNIKLIRLDKRMGQGAALGSGLLMASGDVAVTMDADLQLYPEDIPLLLAKLEEGYDVVSGTRTDRKEKILLKICSKIFAVLIRMFFGIHVNDPSSDFIAVREKFIKNINLKRNDHRYIIPILYKRGAHRIANVNVRHAKRYKGKSKYNLLKIISAIPELFYFLFRFKKVYYNL
jgi:glycosyltransferase involved in cell wall biosynthesis